MELQEGSTGVEEEECEMHKLSCDAMYEILIRATFSTLLRQSRWVCKDWQKLIFCDSKFQQNHSQRTIASGHFIQVRTFNKTFFTFLPRNNSVQKLQSPCLNFLPTAKSITIAGSSLHGSLLCCVTRSNTTPIPSFYMCKPASREWRKIPNPKTRFDNSTIGIAVEQSPCPILRYKVLRLSQSNTGYGYHCQLFNSENWAWRTLPFVQFKRRGTFLKKSGGGIWVNGGLHWLTDYDEVFVFDTDQEKWTTFKVSPDMKNMSRTYKVAVNCDGKLGVIYHTAERMEVWILEEYSTTKPSWKWKYSNDMRSLHENVENVYPHHMWSSNTVMMMGMYELVAFNCDKNTYDRTKVHGASAHLGEPYAFQPQFCYL